MPTKDELAQRIADLIHTEDLGTTLYVEPATASVIPTHREIYQSSHAKNPAAYPLRIAEEVIMWTSTEDYVEGQAPAVDSWQRIEGEGEHPGFYHLFDRAEYIDEGRHILFHIGEMLEPDEPPFLVQTVVVDAYPDESTCSECGGSRTVKMPNWGHDGSHDEECPLCEGTGTGEHNDSESVGWALLAKVVR